MANQVIRAAHYVRSATEEGSEDAFQCQLEGVKAHAAQNGYEIVHEYSDVGSGMASHRPGLHQLEADARLNVYDVLIVYEPSRLFRDVDQLKDYIHHLEALGVTVEFVRGWGDE